MPAENDQACLVITVRSTVMNTSQPETFYGISKYQAKLRQFYSCSPKSQITNVPERALQAAEDETSLNLTPLIQIKKIYSLYRIDWISNCKITIWRKEKSQTWLR